MAKKITLTRQDVTSPGKSKPKRIDPAALQRADKELQRAKEQREAAMKKRTAVPTRCSKQIPAEYFTTFQEVEPGRWAAIGVSADRPTGPAGDQSDPLTATNLDWSGYTICPHCGSKYVFQCGACRHLSCQGAARQEESGQVWVACPWCGTEGYLAGQIESLDGHAAAGKGKPAK